MPGNLPEGSVVGQVELITYVNTSPLAAEARNSEAHYYYEYTLSRYCCRRTCIASDNLCTACHCCREHCSPHTHLWQARLHTDFPLPGRYNCGCIPELEQACEVEAARTQSSLEEQPMPIEIPLVPEDLPMDLICYSCGDAASDLPAGTEFFTMERPQGATWCESCLSDDGFTCAQCENHYSDTYSNEVQSRTGSNELDIVCDFCVSSHCIPCGNCGGYFYRTLQRYWAGIRVCLSCYEEGRTCGDCDCEYFGDDDNHECPDRDDDDDDDYDYRDSASDYIHGYSYTPDRLQFLGDPKDNIYLGVELEVEVPTPHRRGTLADEVGRAMSSFAYLKSDGSLSNGFEIVTHPASLDEHKKLWPRLFYSKPFVKKLRSWDPGTCGLHIHISREPISKLTQAKMVAFCNLTENRPWLIQLAGRESAQYAKFKTVYKLGRAIRSSNDRYEVLNVNNRETLEFRLFKGSLRPERLWRALEFAHSLVYFCQVSGLHELRYTDYLHWLGKHRKDYPAMAEWALPKVAKLSASATADSHPDAAKDLGQDAEVRAAKLAAKEVQPVVEPAPVPVEEVEHGTPQPNLINQVMTTDRTYGISIEQQIRVHVEDAQRYYRDSEARLEYLRGRAEGVLGRVEYQTRAAFSSCGIRDCSGCERRLNQAITEAKERVKQLFGFGGTELLDWWERWDLAERGVIPRQTPQWFIDQQEREERHQRELAERRQQLAEVQARTAGETEMRQEIASSMYDHYFGIANLEPRQHRVITELVDEFINTAQRDLDAEMNAMGGGYTWSQPAPGVIVAYPNTGQVIEEPTGPEPDYAERAENQSPSIAEGRPLARYHALNYPELSELYRAFDPDRWA